MKMLKSKRAPERQFENSFKLGKFFLLLSGIKLNQKPYNRVVDHFINYQLFYLDFIILHSVIFGEVVGVIDCIQTGKTIVELSFNLPCITISVLATVKVLFLYVNRDKAVDLVNKLKEIHCEDDKEGFEEIETVEDRRNLVKESVKMLNIVVLLMTGISVIVQVTFCFVPVLLMAYKYYNTNQLVIIYPFLVKYPYYEVYESIWWPLIYIHQVLATAVSCLNTFGCDVFFFSLCSYIEMHFRLLGMQFEETVSRSRDETKRNLAKAVKKHQDLIELVNQMEFLYTKSTLFHIVTASLLICLSAFLITIADEMNIKFAYVTFLTMSFTQISLICYFADMLMKSSTSISESVYKSGWYEADADAKKIILLVMIRSQKACKLTAWRFVDLNLKAFTRILSTSWSYFALLKTMYK